MTDFIKIRKLLNLTSSPDDAEALSALRLAQKLCGNLGDFLSSDNHGLSVAAAEQNELYEDLQKLYAQEAEHAALLKKKNEEKEKKLRKGQRDVQTLKRLIDHYEERIQDLEEKLSKVLPKIPANTDEAAYRELEELYQSEVEKNEELRAGLEQKNKDLQRFLRENSKLKRDKKTGKAGLSY